MAGKPASESKLPGASKALSFNTEFMVRGSSGGLSGGFMPAASWLKGCMLRSIYRSDKTIAAAQTVPTCVLKSAELFWGHERP